MCIFGISVAACAAGPVCSIPPRGKRRCSDCGPQRSDDSREYIKDRQLFLDFLSNVRLGITRQPSLHLLILFGLLLYFFFLILSILAVVSQRFDRNARRHIVRLLSGTQFSY
jgi:hypothetical protein